MSRALPLASRSSSAAKLSSGLAGPPQKWSPGPDLSISASTMGGSGGGPTIVSSRSARYTQCVPDLGHELSTTSVGRSSIVCSAVDVDSWNQPGTGRLRYMRGACSEPAPSRRALGLPRGLGRRPAELGYCRAV